jgi:hypothetical protein
LRALPLQTRPAGFVSKPPLGEVTQSHHLK